MVAGLAMLILLGLPGRRERYRETLGVALACLLFFVLGCGGGGTVAGGGGGGFGGPGPTNIVLTTSSAKVAQNAPYTITATITSGRALTGTVAFYNFGVPVEGGLSPVNGQVQINQEGYIIYPGVYQITANYGGDPYNGPATSAPLIQVITGTFPITIQGNTGSNIHTLQGTVGVQ